MIRRGMLPALILAAVLALTGCGAVTAVTPDDLPVADLTPLAELAVLDDPRSFEGPSTAVIANSEITPVASDPVQVLPSTVLSHDLNGTAERTVVDTSRVVAIDLAGSIAATVWGLGFGDTLVGRDVSTTFPGAVDLPVVTGDGHTVNAESIISLKPTLVISDGTVGPRDVLEQLRDVGIEVVFVENLSSFDGAAQLARDVAQVFGVPDAGALLADRIIADVAATKAAIAELAPTADKAVRIVFLYLRGAAGVYYLFGEGSGADDLINGLSAVDVAGELGWDGMRPLTDEAIVAANPDLILVMSSGLESVGGIDGLLEAKPAIAITTAGQQRRIVDMADGQILSFGPRAADVLDALARAIYAPQAGG